MRTAWVLFLIGCGFQSRNGSDPGTGSDAGDIADLSPICPMIALGNPQFLATACATPDRALARIAVNTSFDTDSGASTPDSGLTCVRATTGNPATGPDDVCVLAAASIIVEPGVVLSAHG